MHRLKYHGSQALLLLLGLFCFGGSLLAVPTDASEVNPIEVGYCNPDYTERLSSEALGAPALQFFTTFGFQSTAVRSARDLAFRHRLGDPPYRPAALEAFHLDAQSQRTAYDIRMSRPDARTVSYTRFSVQDSRLKMHYLPYRDDAADSLADSNGISIRL